MKKLLILFAICLCAISCEQNDVIDTKVKIEKVIPDGVYIETLSWYWKNNDDRLCCIGCKDPNITIYILIENNRYGAWSYECRIFFIQISLCMFY